MLCYVRDWYVVAVGMIYDYYDKFTDDEILDFRLSQFLWHTSVSRRKYNFLAMRLTMGVRKAEH